MTKNNAPPEPEAIDLERPTGEIEAPSKPESEIETLKREKQELFDRVARMQAEFDNARKRAVREQQDFRDYAITDAIMPLLPILDSLDRALHFENTTTDDLHSGVELIQKQLLDALGKLGVRRIGAHGEPFDPHQHQAIEMVETNEAPDQHVLEELQPGYKLKDRLLRPAMVRVASNPKGVS